MLWVSCVCSVWVRWCVLCEMLNAGGDPKQGLSQEPDAECLRCPNLHPGETHNQGADRAAGHHGT